VLRAFWGKAIRTGRRDSEVIMKSVEEVADEICGYADYLGIGDGVR
jgi:hypothetical protein